QLQRLKRNPVFAKAFDQRRTEAEVAFQIRRLRFGEEGRLQPAGDISRRTSALQTALSAVTSSHRRRLRRRRRRRFVSTQGRVGYLSAKPQRHDREITEESKPSGGL